jgi:hypothetical protein
MTKLLKTGIHWNVATSALNGALLGLLIGMASNYFDVFYKHAEPP